MNKLAKIKSLIKVIFALSGLTCTICTFILVLTAYLNNFRVLVDINMYSEGTPELILVTFFLIFSIFGFYFVITDDTDEVDRRMR
jgi:hypothetical protein